MYFFRLVSYTEAIFQRKEVRRLLQKFADEIQAKKDLDAYVEARNERQRARRKRIREEIEREKAKKQASKTNKTNKKAKKNKPTKENEQEVLNKLD